MRHSGKILGWGDVGIGHVMFRKGEGKPEIRTPEDLKQYHPFYISGDSIGSMFLATLGIQSPKALSVPAILPAIAGRNSDSVDVITTPAIAAEQLQWAPHVTHVVDMPVGFGIGGLVMDKEFYKSIPDGLQAGHRGHRQEHERAPHHGDPRQGRRGMGRAHEDQDGRQAHPRREGRVAGEVHGGPEQAEGREQDQRGHVEGRHGRRQVTR